jgi:hypothetical protein
LSREEKKFFFFSFVLFFLFFSLLQMGRPQGLTLPGESASKKERSKTVSLGADSVVVLTENQLFTLLGSRKPVYPCVLDLA